MIKYVRVKVVYNNFEGGFWGFIDKKGNQLLPIYMPYQLMYDGETVKIGYRHSDMVSMMMWGDSIEIVSFETIG